MTPDEIEAIRERPSRVVDMTGQRIGRLVVAERAPRRPGVTKALWLCRCDCGTETVVWGTNLRQSKTTSCGCVLSDFNRQARTTHGMSKKRTGQRHPLYNIWLGIRKRCLQPSSRAYKHYGGRGIRLAEEWMDFPTFARDVGPRPSLAHSIDRIDNDGNYEPGNVRWATAKVQAGNRRRSNG